MSTLQRNIVHAAVLALALAGAAGCGGGTAEFAPVNQSGVTQQLPPATYYDIVLAEQRIGNVRVWSPGTFYSASSQFTKEQKAQMKADTHLLHVAWRVR